MRPLVSNVALALLATGLAFGTGCAAMKANRARTEALRAQLDAHRFASPLPEVWQEVRRLLHERRHGLAGKDLEALGLDAPSGLIINIFSPARETRPGPAGGLTLETGWGPGGVRRRYHVEGSEGPGGARVVFVAITEDQTEHGRDGRDRARDLELELLLVRRLDPEAGERIEQAAGRAP